MTQISSLACLMLALRTTHNNTHSRVSPNARLTPEIQLQPRGRMAADVIDANEAAGIHNRLAPSGMIPVDNFNNRRHGSSFMKMVGPARQLAVNSSPSNRKWSAVYWPSLIELIQNACLPIPR
ncbi:uncharacterized protein BDZ83DRAFT_73034 [Colletotrichum acutatum]|uniref:Uncharacterized protein n=1 Tax=Glomerella acutata TaxID=27357 RepID=A0AAD8UEB5_GLOAC|nr:uncharacterized protein BDZ83DRAFT_73034 [Colletotrichum acutatum]KAK1714514.1 hypothetical protein BDZ83DRAFT_73034 [Colletotrichum acutatum]